MPTRARLVALACAALPLAAACAPVDLHQDIINVNDPSNDASVGFYLIRDDLHLDPLNNNVGTHYTYFFSIDGTYATWNTSVYATFNPDWYVPLGVPSGVHVFGIVDQATRAATTIPAIEARPSTDPTPGIVQNRRAPYTEAVFFGGANGMNTRVFVNDLAAVPAGTIHVRVMNALSDHQPLQIVRCPASFEGNSTYKGSDCAPVGDPLAYGDVYETNETPDVAATIGFHWAPPGASSLAVTSISRADAGAFNTHIPAEHMGPQDTCPGCFFRDL